MAVWLTVCALAQNAYSFWIEDEPFRVGFLFDTRYEGTPIDWYTALALFLCAVLTATVAKVSKAHGLGHTSAWVLLAALFAVLSLDEAAGLHERANAIIGLEFDLDGIFASAWTLPASILVALVGLAYVPLVRDLPGRIRGVVILAGTVYLAGALGLEMVSSLLLEAETIGYTGMGQAVAEAAQNLLEMVGVAIMAYALLLFLARLRPLLRVGFGE